MTAYHDCWVDHDDVLEAVSERWRQDVHSVLCDEYADQSTFDTLAGAYLAGRDLTETDRGALGFIWALRVADRINSGDASEDEKDDLRALLRREPAISPFIVALYRLHESARSPALAPREIIGVGDTSLVVACDEHCAVKILFPWFAGSAALRHDLADFMTSVESVQYVAGDQLVHVFEGHPEHGWLALSRLSGQTLRELLDTNRSRRLEEEEHRQRCAQRDRPKRRSRPLLRGADDRAQWLRDENRRCLVHPRRLDDAELIAKGLTGSVSHLQAHGLTHRDLTPQNVMLTGGPRDEIAGVPTVVDFGPSLEALRYAGRHSVTDVYADADAEGWRALADDMNAIGDVVLATLVTYPAEHLTAAPPGGPEAERMANERAMIEDAARHLRNVAPRVGGTLQRLREDGSLLQQRWATADAPPSTRTPARLFAKLSEDFLAELRLFRDMSDGSDDPLTAIRRPRSLRPRELAKLGEVFVQARYKRSIAGAIRNGHGADWPTIDTWLRVYGVVWWLTILVFVALTAISFGGVADLFVPPEWIAKHLDHGLYSMLPGGVPNHWLLLEYRLVSLTTAAIAFIYYLNIFSALDAGSVPRYLVGLMRWGPLTAILLQLGGLVFFPYGFAWVAGVGGIFICVNNQLWLRIIKRRLTKESEEYKHFKNWPLMMWFFSGGGIGIGILLDLNVLTDAWFFALGLTVLNCTKVYLTNCTADAPLARGWLTQAAYAYEPKRNPLTAHEEAAPSAVPLPSET